jgi:hypothetical protein
VIGDAKLEAVCHFPPPTERSSQKGLGKWRSNTKAASIRPSELTNVSLLVTVHSNGKWWR